MTETVERQLYRKIERLEKFNCKLYDALELVIGLICDRIDITENERETIIQSIDTLDEDVKDFAVIVDLN